MLDLPVNNKLNWHFMGVSKNLLYTFVAALIASCIEVDVSAPSLPDISDYFNVSDGIVQMTIAVNFFGFCISAAIYGPLSENFGRRQMMLIGNAIMTLGAAGCMVADSIEFLLVSRFIQGLGASASSVVVFVMIADLCQGRQAADVIAKLSSLITIIMSIAPILGSIINETIGWRGSYGFVFLVSFMALLMLNFNLPETKKGFEPISTKKITSDYFRLFSSYKFIIIATAPSIMFASFISFVACGSFLYMETYGQPIMLYAIHQGSLVASFSLISQKSGYICRKLGEINCIQYGVGMQILSALLLLGLGIIKTTNPYIVTLTMIIGTIGAAISYPLIFAKSFEVHPEIKGAASSAVISIRMFTSGAAVAWVSAIYDGSLLAVAQVVFTCSFSVALLTILILKNVSFAEA